jgi:uncharacterized protein
MEERRPEREGQDVSFLVDRMLGTLARNLRMFGFDAEFASGRLAGLSQRAQAERRCLLSRRSLIEAKPSSFSFLRIPSDCPSLQVVQVLRALSLTPSPALWFSRCLRCNYPLVDLRWDAALGLVPEHVMHVHRRFRQCRRCGRIFWAGTHSLRMRRTMEEWVEDARRPASQDSAGGD